MAARRANTYKRISNLKLAGGRVCACVRVGTRPQQATGAANVTIHTGRAHGALRAPVVKMDGGWAGGGGVGSLWEPPRPSEERPLVSARDGAVPTSSHRRLSLSHTAVYLY